MCSWIYFIFLSLNRIQLPTDAECCISFVCVDCMDGWAVARVEMLNKCILHCFLSLILQQKHWADTIFVKAPNTNVLCSLFIRARHTERIKHCLKIYQLDNDIRYREKSIIKCSTLFKRFLHFFRFSFGNCYCCWCSDTFFLYHLFVCKVFFSFRFRKERREKNERRCFWSELLLLTWKHNNTTTA